MISTYFLNFENEFLFLNENINIKYNIFNLPDFSFFFYIYDFTDYGFVKLNEKNKSHSSTILSFINQTEDIFFFNNLENIKSVYHYSVPNTKLAYPEPFIASASLMHSDLWFIHILVYQYWLWFVFVFLIIFFFITFICTIRWCNIRIRPRRETRGVSRSKCGDLITATVPVSWATSIIIHESTDAIDYYDGFGTAELVVGIRAYQWGWEYYYPKDIDLNYNIKHNYSTFVGNSLKYNSTTDLNLNSNNMWKFYQNKNLDAVVTPAHLLFLPIDNFKFLNFLNFNDIGSNPLNESTAFKKTKMFTKTNYTNLAHIPYNYDSKYKNFSLYFDNDNSYIKSINFGIKKQHNLLNTSSINNAYATFFDLKSIKKWSFHNFDLFSQSNRSNDLKFLSFFKKNKLSQNGSDSLRVLHLFSKNFSNHLNVSKFIYFPNFLQLINDDSDKKKTRHPLYKLNISFKKYANFTNLNTFLKIFASHDAINFSQTQENNLFNNQNKSYKLFSPFSANQSVLTGSKSLRNFININPSSSTFNHNLNLNPVAHYLNFLNHQTHSTNFFLFNVNNTKWIDLITLNKLSSNRIYLDSPISPILSNNLFLNTANYDSTKHTFIENTPTVLQGKEEQLPTSLINTYWNFYWNNSNLEWRIKNNFNYNLLQSNFYLPIFNFYYDYDFRNWQSFELFEDMVWESIYSIYTFDEYLSATKEFYNPLLLDKYDKIYYRSNFPKHRFLTDSILPSFAKTSYNDENETYYSTSFYIDDASSALNFIKTDDFSLFCNTNLQTLIDDSYENLKFLNYLYNHNFKLFNFSATNFFLPLSTTTVFDIFRSDYDEFSWFFDDTNFLFEKFKPEFYQKFIYEENFENLHKKINKLVKEFDFEKINIIELNLIHDFYLNAHHRFSDYINMRAPIRNSIVTYNALQKVFRARFDEGRSNVGVFDYANSYGKQPFITAARFKYERLLSKNKENFLNSSLYKPNNLQIFNTFYDSINSLNFYIFDFPFLLAMKSDASRYLWFDWFTKWGFYEVQPSSSSRYAIYGMPYFNKSFEFGTQSSDVLNESENYFLRLSKARRNYLPNWSYTPYIYAKTSTWWKTNTLFEIFKFEKFNLNTTNEIISFSNWYWTKKHFITNNSSIFFPSSSNMNSYAKSFWKPESSVQSYYYVTTNLIDILTKREYLYREYLSNSHKIIKLPIEFTASSSHPILNELKAAFFFTDSIIFNNEYSRDIYFNSLNFFHLNILKPFLNSISDVFNISLINDYLFYYFFNNKIVSNFKSNQELYQNQYRPMRKGVTNMIRLHATGAIAMPIEVKLQILASSKDVIHSWAIPSAGIKIDCVPGYSSHKVTIFLVSGIFWGQCMEICGRYHHWMPIIVYFMKRDLFFLWCTHFVFLSGANNMWNINDRQYTDYVRSASFDKLSWLSEINNF